MLASVATDELNLPKSDRKKESSPCMLRAINSHWAVLWSVKRTTKTTAKKSVSFSFLFGCLCLIFSLTQVTCNIRSICRLQICCWFSMFRYSPISCPSSAHCPDGTWKKRFFRKRANSLSHKIDSREWTTADSFVLRSNSTWLYASSKRLLPCIISQFNPQQ